MEHQDVKQQTQGIFPAVYAVRGDRIVPCQQGGGTSGVFQRDKNIGDRRLFQKGIPEKHGAAQLFHLAGAEKGQAGGTAHNLNHRIGIWGSDGSVGSFHFEETYLGGPVRIRPLVYHRVVCQHFLKFLLHGPFDYIQYVLKMVVKSLAGNVAGFGQVLDSYFIYVLCLRQLQKGLRNNFFYINWHCDMLPFGFNGAFGYSESASHNKEKQFMILPATS